MAKGLEQKQQSKGASKEETLTDDPNFDRKLDIVTAGAKPFVKEHLLTKISRVNCSTIVKYMMAMQTEVNPTEAYQVTTILKLKHFAEVIEPKTFNDVTRQDVIDFLDSYRKPESVDPLHRWMGSYELYRIILMRFLRWLYSPDLPPRQRPRPEVMQNIPKPRRKEVSTYKPTDLWTESDDALFYKYCPSTRDRAWHSVSRDTGCRPSEKGEPIDIFGDGEHLQKIDDPIVLETLTRDLENICKQIDDDLQELREKVHGGDKKK